MQTGRKVTGGTATEMKHQLEIFTVSTRKLSIYLPCSAVIFVGSYLKGMKSYVHTKT